MEKQKAAPQNGTTPNTQPEHSSTTSRCATKLKLTALHLLENGPTGSSSLSGLAGLHYMNFRNSVSDLRKLGIHIPDERFPHQHTEGQLVYLKRKAREAEPLGKEQITCYLEAFPNSAGNHPAASDHPQPVA